MDRYDGYDYRSMMKKKRKLYLKPTKDIIVIPRSL